MTEHDIYTVLTGAAFEQWYDNEFAGYQQNDIDATKKIKAQIKTLFNVKTNEKILFSKHLLLAPSQYKIIAGIKLMNQGAKFAKVEITQFEL